MSPFPIQTYIVYILLQNMLLRNITKGGMKPLRVAVAHDATYCSGFHLTNVLWFVLLFCKIGGKF